MGKEKQTVRIADLIPKPVDVEVSAGKFMTVNSLSLEQIVKLLWLYQEPFLRVYAEGLTAKPNYESLIIAAPDMVADIIAMGADADGQQEDIKRLPGTVQLVALKSIWAMSVPDPKKLLESLSEVMGYLRRLSSEREQSNPIEPQSTTVPETTSRSM